jgi:hypothetical protein
VSAKNKPFPTDGIAAECKDDSGCEQGWRAGMFALNSRVTTNNIEQMTAIDSRKTSSCANGRSEATMTPKATPPWQDS